MTADGGHAARVLVVCTHNRVRSVMAEHLVRRAATACGASLEVQGAGFGPAGHAPLEGTLLALARLGVDAAATRSRRVDPATIAAADVILTAERLHVMRIAEDDAGVFARTFTLPELVALAEAGECRAGRDVGVWLRALGRDRTPATFLAGEVPEIADPAGGSPADFRRTADLIDDLARRLVARW